MSSEDRIRKLCARVVSETDETAVRQLVGELQSALAEYVKTLRGRAAVVADKIYALQLEPRSDPDRTETLDSEREDGLKRAAAE